MQTIPINRIRRFLAAPLSMPAFKQMPPDVQAILWFLAGFLTAWVLPVVCKVTR
jgi:hypothetical protein